MRRKQSEEAKFPRVLPDKAAFTYKHSQSHTHLFPSPLLFSDIPNPCSPSQECWRGARGKDSLSTENLGCHLEEEKKACQLLGIKGGSWGTCSGAKPTNLLVSLPQLEQAAASKAGFSENTKYENGGFSTSGFLK